MSSTPSKIAAAQLGERRGAADRVEQVVDVPVVHRDHRDDLLREHVERVARIADRLDVRLVHRARDRGARDQVAAELREDDAAAGRADVMAGAADALHAARDRGRRLDLDDQIDRAHVDAELERGGRDERRAACPPSAGLRSRCAAARASDAVMRAHQRLAREIVSAPASRSARRRLLTKMSVERCARTSSSSRGWIALQIDGRTGPCDAGPLGISSISPSLRHVLDRHFDRSSSCFFCAGVDDRDRPVASAVARSDANSSWIGVVADLGCRPRRLLVRVDGRTASRAASAPPRKRATSSSGRCVADSPMRCSGASPHERFQPLERQRQVRAALGRDQRMDLVDDDGVDRAQRLARVRGQQQVERFRRRDQDVGRLALEPGALARRRVAGADRDRRRRGTRRPARARDCAMPASGARRFRSTSTASALSGEM